MRISDWSSDVCSSDLADPVVLRADWLSAYDFASATGAQALNDYARTNDPFAEVGKFQVAVDVSSVIRASKDSFRIAWTERRYQDGSLIERSRWSRSEEHTSELQSLMRISYAVFCLKKKKIKQHI